MQVKIELSDFMASRESDFPIHALNEFTLLMDLELEKPELIKRVKCFFENYEHYLGTDDQIILNYMLEE